MNQTWQSAVSFSPTGVIALLFFIVIAMVVRYLISVLKLLHQVRTAEPDLWISLGKPTMFSAMFNTPSMQIRGFLSQFRFFVWFIKGGKGAEIPETRAMVEKTRRLFYIATIGMAMLFAFLAYSSGLWFS